MALFAVEHDPNHSLSLSATEPQLRAAHALLTTLLAMVPSERAFMERVGFFRENAAGVALGLRRGVGAATPAEPDASDTSDTSARSDASAGSRSRGSDVPALIADPTRGSRGRLPLAARDDTTPVRGVGSMDPCDVARGAVSVQYRPVESERGFQ